MIPPRPIISPTRIAELREERFRPGLTPAELNELLDVYEDLLRFLGAIGEFDVPPDVRGSG